MRIVVTGASGLLGTALVSAFRADGRDVTTLVRRPPRRPDEVRWDPDQGRLDATELARADAVVHLAGAGVGDHRWTAAYRQQILDSRVRGTRLIAGALADRAAPDGACGAGPGAGRPPVLLSASGVGWYGLAADEPVDETAPAGTGFLADVVRAWEEATTQATEAGLRVCLLRTGPVLAAGGGVLARQLPLFRLGLGGPLGSGRQWLSWIGLDDWVSAVRFLLAADGGPASGQAASSGLAARVPAVAGPVNLVAPGTVTGAEFARTLGAVLHRPAVLPVPRLVLRAVIGGFTDEGVLASQRVIPRVLTDAGFEFRHSTLHDALTAALAG